MKKNILKDKNNTEKDALNDHDKYDKIIRFGSNPQQKAFG